MTSMSDQSESARPDLMRRLRSAWILLTNGATIYLMYASTQAASTLYHSLQRDSQNKAVWLNFGLEAIIPALGVLLEFLSSRFAKWVNVGFFVFGGVVSAGVGLWNWSNPDYHPRLYLQLGLLALVVAVVNYLLYCRTDSSPGPIG
jgi:hypothetical protein